MQKKIYWIGEEKSAIGQDWTAFRNGSISKMALREKYRGRSVDAIRVGARKHGGEKYLESRLRVNGGAKHVSNGVGVDLKIPNRFLWLAKRMEDNGIPTEKIQAVLVANNRKLGSTQIADIERAANASGAVTVKIMGIFRSRNFAVKIFK